MFTRITIALAIFAAACGAKQSPPAAPPQVESSPLATACDGGIANSCLVAANDAEAAGDLAGAAQRYGQACELGESSGCALAGGILAETGKHDDAVKAFAAGCELGDPTSCYGAGLLALGVYSGEPDYTQAAVAFEKACAAGLADGCGEFAGLIATGQGVDLDLERAARLRTRACDAGHSSSCTRLGLQAWRNQSDQPAARNFFERACLAKAPDVDGCGWLGWMLWSGLGGASDEGRGVALLEASCEGDSANGCALRAYVHRHVGETDDGEVRLRRACELDPGNCEAMQRKFAAPLER